MATQDQQTEVPDERDWSAAAAELFGPEGPFAAYARSVDARAMFEQGLDLYKSMFEIALGKSEIAPDPRDWRFQDEAWTSNPFYKRLSQAYLAMTDAVEEMIPEELPWEQKARAQLAASIVTSAFAPTNTLLGNPAAINKTIETGGSNLVKGFQAFLKDMIENEGLPRQVDDSQFEVGRNLAVTPGKIVHKTDMFELIHYKPATENVYELPVLLIPPQIGRYYFTDLAPGRSFAEYAVSQGLQYFAISWRNPSPDERNFGLEDYAKAALEAIEAVTKITGQKKANVVGFCAGGILTSIVAAYLAAKGSKMINTFTMCVTMLDFKNDASLGAFRLPTLLTVAKAQSAMKGILPGGDLHRIFSWLRPNDLIWNYWVNNYLMGDTPAPFDILAWNNDSTNMAAKLHKDFLKLFDSNCLIEPGGYELMGEPVTISDIKCDMFVVGAVTDHLTPWKCCYKSRSHLGGDTVFALSNGGHVAALVNPPGNPKAYHWIGPAKPKNADKWMEKAEKLPGSWWESWAKWCAERSGKQVPAPESLGSEDFPPTVDAPGEYVSL
ncbi:MAG: alpha/beta fold hydrolase [Novosphingobium sp.]|nr:alpha/beta fold hydrolase [Novosphingobium sp.]MCP5404168.1 alpha/beta fold hydrolase [Novosphingobium sp.]